MGLDLAGSGIWGKPTFGRNVAWIQMGEASHHEPRSKLPAIDFSIRWNLFFKTMAWVSIRKWSNSLDELNFGDHHFRIF